MRNKNTNRVKIKIQKKKKRRERKLFFNGFMQSAVRKRHFCVEMPKRVGEKGKFF